jgi:hypothetical protein
MILSPTVLSVSWQLPLPPLRVPLQEEVPPLALTMTLPVGVPPLDATRKLTVNAEPAAEGSGESAVIVVVVPTAPSSISLEVT